MLLAQWTAIDGAVVAFSLLVVIATGLTFAGRQTLDAYLLASRSMSGWPLGLSLVATWLTPLVFVGLSAAAGARGLVLLAIPVAAWLTLPLLVPLVVPLWHGLGLTSIYEYLELRFDRRARRTAVALFCAWRPLLIVVATGVPLGAFLSAAGLGRWSLGAPVVAGIVATLVAWRGGMRAVVWTDVALVALIFVGAAAVVGGVWSRLDEGPGRVWDVAVDLGRTDLLRPPLAGDVLADGATRPTEGATRPADGAVRLFAPGRLWGGLLPAAFVLLLALLVGDQVMAQRFVCGKSRVAVQRAYILFCVAVTLLVPLLTYAGLATLAYYHDRPDELRGAWVACATVDSRTGEPLVDRRTGRPLIHADTDLLGELNRLIAAGALADPNTGEPFSRPGEVIDVRTGRVNLDRIARRRTTRGELVRRRMGERPELVIQRGRDRMLPHLIGNRLAPGLAGLVVAALLAACISTLDSAIHSSATLVATELGGDLRAAGASALGLGIVATCGLAAAAHWGARPGGPTAGPVGLFALLVGLGGPLASLFLLGMLSRKPTGSGALVGVAAGVAVVVGLSVTAPLGPAWPIVAGAATTLVVGYLASLIVGSRKERAELSGLVQGAGRLGRRPEPLEVATDLDEERWR